MHIAIYIEKLSFHMVTRQERREERIKGGRSILLYTIYRLYICIFTVCKSNLILKRDERRQNQEEGEVKKVVSSILSFTIVTQLTAAVLLSQLVYCIFTH